MPTGMTFNSLIDDSVAYMQRGNLTTDEDVYDQIPNFINLAERRIARELKIQGFENVVTSAFINGTPAYAKPDRWRETISINFGSGTNNNTRAALRQLSYEAANLYWPNRSTKSTPRFYAEYDYSHILIVPTPDAAYPFEWVFWQLPPLLDATTQTNWLTDYAPNALLHGTLVEMCNFLNNDAATKWMEEYNRDMAALGNEDISKILDRYYRRKTS